MPSSYPIGPVMLDLRGPELSSEEAEWLRHPAAGGLIYFTRNYESPEQIAALTKAVRAVRPELLIAVDHEGGRVQRFRAGFTRLPAAAQYALALSEQPEELMQTLELGGWLMAMELRAVDVDFSFAPVLDVDTGISAVIGDRSFATDAEQAGSYALAFARGMRRAGMASVGKHFPGHGAVAVDSHVALPEDPRPYEAIASKDLLPFQQLIAAGLDAVMPAHVVYSACDDHPAGFSRYWIDQVLRRQLGFSGAIFSDDLSMEGAACIGGYEDRAHAAIEAGCDMVLVCNHPEAIGPVLESLERENWTRHQPQLKRLGGQFPVDRNALLASSDWQKAAKLMEKLTATVTA